MPTQSVEAATVIVFSGSISLGSTPTFDVSAYRKIRVSVASSFAGGGRATIFNVDGSHRMTLAIIASLAAGGPGTALIDLPGRTIQVEGANLNGTTLDELLIDGR